MAGFALLPLLQGIGVGAGLIIAIGAQNAFVLRQGLKRRHIFATAGISTVCDAILIALGVGGLGTLIATTPALTTAATWGGAAFLDYYGLRSFRSALSPAALTTDEATQRPANLRGTVLAAFGFSLLNPHVYLDTVVLIGSVGAQYPANDRISFGLGAMLASLIWFFGLAYGAAWLAPHFQRPVVWRILDTGIGCIMCLIATSLIWEPVKAVFF
jgi:L-lysine exporter family protein LysE/ArgO